MSDKYLRYTKALSYSSELTTDLDATEVQFGEAMNFSGMGILQGRKWQQDSWIIKTTS